jgi:putative modified peptide
LLRPLGNRTLRRRIREVRRRAASPGNAADFVATDGHGSGVRRHGAGVCMSDAVLTHDQATKLLRELEVNSGFRQRYEEKPAAAMLEIGIPATTIANLPAACLAPKSLDCNEKTLRETREILQNATLVTRQSMAIPHLRK